jgi:4-aminobutyrate aminotransferase and related aminotransferases
VIEPSILERVQSHVRDFARSTGSHLFTRAQGSVLADACGRQYIDFSSAAGALNYGHDNPLLMQMLRRRLKEVGRVPDLSTSLSRFRDAIEGYLLRPRGWEYAVHHTGSTAVAAVEAALKVARKATGRHKVVSFTRCDMIRPGPNCNNEVWAACTGVGDTLFMPYDGSFGPDVDTMSYLERQLDMCRRPEEKPAAVVVETVLGESGVDVLSWRWLRDLETLCRRHGMLLIMDETIVGCGRTGRFFSYEASGVRADMIALSRSLSGFGLPTSVLLRSPSLPAVEYLPPVSDERAGLALLTAEHVLEAYWADDSFAVHVRRKERLVRDWLENLVHTYSHLGLGVRGRGLIQGLVTPPSMGLALEMANKALATGLVCLTTGSNDEVLKVQPALTIDEEMLVHGLEILDRCVSDVLESRSGL